MLSEIFWEAIMDIKDHFSYIVHEIHMDIMRKLRLGVSGQRGGKKVTV